MMVFLLDLTKLGDEALTFRSLTELQTVVEIRNTKKRSRLRVLLATNLQMVARLTTALLRAKRIPEPTGPAAENQSLGSVQKHEMQASIHRNPSTNIEIVQQFLPQTWKCFDKFLN